MSENIIYPFKTNFLRDFSFAPDSILMDDTTLKEMDSSLVTYERLTANPNLEKALIDQNELFASFAISKAENSTLTLREAADLQALLVSDQQYDFIVSKLNLKKQLNQKDHDKLEFFNIVKTFRTVNQRIWSLDEITPKMIAKLHVDLTKGLDIFSEHLMGFDIYKSGVWRDNDLIRVGTYEPPSFVNIPPCINELVEWLKYSKKSPINISIFHTALYALHPFNNGNKRVCRMLEHILLRSIGYNQKNLYSQSYYYHSEKTRYYKHLLYSLEYKNLNQFVSYGIEALSSSILGVIKTSLEIKRDEFLSKSTLDLSIKNILKPLLKRNEIQFKLLLKINSHKMARQTFVTYLEKAVDQQVITKRNDGKKVFYSLAIKHEIEQKAIHEWIDKIKNKLRYIPPDLLQY